MKVERIVLSVILSVRIFQKFIFFFDYDIHNQDKSKSLDRNELNNQLSKLLDFFDDETGQGKLFINYPMVESIRYTKKLPDEKYDEYIFRLDDLSSFKEKAAEFSYYKNLDFIALRFRKNRELVIPSENRRKEIEEHWRLIIKQNAAKAHHICSSAETISLLSISQQDIFLNQMEKFFSKGFISILNSFPLFLIEYFGPSFI